MHARVIIWRTTKNLYYARRIVAREIVLTIAGWFFERSPLFAYVNAGSSEDKRNYELTSEKKLSGRGARINYAVDKIWLLLCPARFYAELTNAIHLFPSVRIFFIIRISLVCPH